MFYSERDCCGGGGGGGGGGDVGLPYLVACVTDASRAYRTRDNIRYYIIIPSEEK